MSLLMIAMVLLSAPIFLSALLGALVPGYYKD